MREFELSVHAYSNELYRYAYWLTKHPSDAEDLVQDCFQRAWRSWHTLKNEKAVKQWLFAILRHEFLRRFEKERPEFSSLDEHLELPAIGVAEDDILALRQAIQQAPVSLRDPFLLQVLGGFSCEEIAQIENTTPGAVMTRLTRARQWFRNFLNPVSIGKESQR